MLVNGEMDKFWSSHTWECYGYYRSHWNGNEQKPSATVRKEREQPDAKGDFLDNCFCIKYRNRQN